MKNVLWLLMALCTATLLGCTVKEETPGNGGLQDNTGSASEGIVLTFPNSEGTLCMQGETVKIDYKLTGGVDVETEVEANCRNVGWQAEIHASDMNSGMVVVTNNAAESDGTVVVTATNGAGSSDSKALVFENGVLSAEADVSIVGGEATVIDVEVTTNVDYEISIPDEARGWISVVEGTKSVLRTETVSLAVSEYYREGPVRSATVCFMVEGKEAARVYIEQTSLWEDIKNVPIEFADLSVKKILINSDNPVIDVNRDGEISYEEAAACTSLPEFANTDITSFDELKYFTALHTIGEDTFVNSSAFYGCSSLRSIKLPESLTSIGISAFDGCSSLRSIELPESLTSIGCSAFEGCSSLESIELPESLTWIGGYAFQYCSSLESIELPESLTSIEISAFSGCSSLESIELPESLTSIERSAFEGCSSLRSIELPESLTSIGIRAFDGCSSLRSIELPESLTSIENYTFYGCSSLESIELPKSLTSIEEGAFWGCSSLRSIELPESLTSIENYTFYRCSSLESIELPESLTSIEESVFSGCSSLRSIELPESLTSIGIRAFEGCSSLRSIELPESLTSIENYTFYRCSSLKKITFNSELPPEIYYNAFYDCVISSVYIPEYASFDSYNRVLSSLSGFENATIFRQ